MTTASNAILTTSIDSTGILSLGTGTATGTTLGKSGQDTNIAGNVKTANITISNPEELNYSVQISQNSILLGTTETNLELTQTQIKVNGNQGSSTQVFTKDATNNVIWANPAFVPTADQDLNMNSNDIHNIASLNAISATTMNINGQTQFDTQLHIPDPILGNDVASKGYVDTLIGNYSGNGLSLYFNYATLQANPIIAPSVGVLEQTLSPINSFTSNNFYIMRSVALGNDTLISTFTTDVGYPNTLTIPAGLWSMLIWGYITSATGQLYYYFKLNEVDSAGNVVQQIGTSGFSSDVNAISSTDPDAYHCSLAIVNGYTMHDVNNRLQIQIFTIGTGTGSATLSTLFGGQYYSNITTTLNRSTSLLTQNNTWTGSNEFTAGFNTTSVDSLTTLSLGTGTATTTLGRTATGTTTNVKGATIHVGDDTSITNVKGLRVTNIDSITAGNMSIGSTNTSSINLNSKPISNLALASSQYINIGTSVSALTTPTVNQVGYVVRTNALSPTFFGTSPSTPYTINQTYPLPAGVWMTSATAGINCTVSGTITSISLSISNPSAVGTNKLVAQRQEVVTKTVPVSLGNMFNVSGILFCPQTTTITLSQTITHLGGSYRTAPNNYAWFFMRIA